MSGIHIGWPQAIYLGLTLMGVGVAMARYGEPKRDRYDVFDLLIGPAFGTALLYWGGFFS